MTKEPTLAVTSYHEKPRKTFGRGITMTVRAVGGLHYIKSNRAPYFALTKEEHRKGFPNQRQSFGADHDTILRYWPKFADLAALHLSNIDGVPMHAESNAWYDLAGALPNFAGEEYHAGNSERNFPLPAERIDPAQPWRDTEYRKPTPDECLEMFAHLVRVDLETARKVQSDVTHAWHLTRVACERENVHFMPWEAFTWTKSSWSAARAWLANWIEEQKPRWKAEAEACIAHHGLRVFGDTWPDTE